MYVILYQQTCINFTLQSAYIDIRWEEKFMSTHRRKLKVGSIKENSILCTKVSNVTELA